MPSPPEGRSPAGPPYRLGFAVKVLGGGGLRTADTRRWQSRPQLSVSIEYLHDVWAYLDRVDIRVYRLAGSVVPYGTHPDLPELDYRRQIEECADRLEQLGERARELGLRLSTHPGQYTRINAPDPGLAAKSALDLEQDALLFEALGLGPEAVSVVHVGAQYGDQQAALDRWARAYEALSERARSRVVVENDERWFGLDDVLELHRRTGVRVVFDSHHHRCNPGREHRDVGSALAAAAATWPDGVRAKIHVSSARTELRIQKRRRAGSRRAEQVLVAPLLDQHGDFATPWDVAEVLDAADVPVDVVIEAKAKDLAVLWLRDQLARVRPDLAAREERRTR